MKIIKKSFVSDEIKNIKFSDIFLDIETTGLSKYSDYAWVIGIGYRENDDFVVEQIFIKSLVEEKDQLIYLNDKLKQYERIITFNGNNFDIPFLKKRATNHKLELDFPEKNLDYFRLLKTSDKFLDLDSYSLVDLEKLMNIERDDPLRGKKTLELYKMASELDDEKIYDMVLNHNFYDIKNLPLLFRVPDLVLDIKTLKFNTVKFIINNFYIDRDMLFVEMISDDVLSKIYINNNDLTIRGSDGKYNLLIPIKKTHIENELTISFKNNGVVIKKGKYMYYNIKNELYNRMKAIILLLQK